MTSEVTSSGVLYWILENPMRPIYRLDEAETSWPKRVRRRQEKFRRPQAKFAATSGVALRDSIRRKLRRWLPEFSQAESVRTTIASETAWFLEPVMA